MFNKNYSGFFVPQVPKRKVFVSYHHANDQQYYNYFSSHFSENYDIIYDNSLERKIDSDDVNYVMRRIREDYITGSSCTIVLCGSETQNRKYVDWEIKATLDKNHALIGVQLPSAIVDVHGNVYVPDRFAKNYNNGYATWITWQQLFNAGYGLSHYINEAVERSNRSTYLIDNSQPLMARNKSSTTPK